MVSKCDKVHTNKEQTMSEADDVTRLKFQRDWERLVKEIDNAEKGEMDERGIEQLLSLRQRQLALVQKAKLHEKEFSPVRRSR